MIIYDQISEAAKMNKNKNKFKSGLSKINLSEMNISKS